MRAIVIGAGRGSRLGHNTDHIPKTLVEVMGRPMLDWILEALASAGFERKDVVFVSGYAEDVVRARYPEFTFVQNADWANNNILLSLMCAREHLAGGFLSTYADIVYDGEIVQKLVASQADIALGCDTAWRRRYLGRSQHPETDAEKLRADGTRVLEISRTIASEAAHGEFIGVMKLSESGARVFSDAFDRAQRTYGGGMFREGRSFQKAYLLDLLQEMLEAGASMHRENTAGGYMEIDTGQDLAMAQGWWGGWLAEKNRGERP
ncbi:MAG TPA: phosphocholine cytidylyltransferase family protein [Polyangiaceae bacterium]|nr:phosphocholine cytidylyltransferase family protein [Polyangiaceae bacterium]